MTNWNLQEKPSTAIGGWEYNEPGYAYDQALDPVSDNPVYYNGAGSSTTWNLQAKS